MPDESIEVNLAKALKLKNRIAGRISKLSADIQANNSLAEGADRPDVPAMMAGRDVLVARLVDLKVAINAANRSIQRKIYELAELKSKIDLLSKLNTTHGQALGGLYASAMVTYVAQIRKGAVDHEVRLLEREIDARQDALDTFNHETRIRVDASLLADEGPPPPG